MLITTFFSLLCFMMIIIQINSSIIAKRKIKTNNFEMFKEIKNKIDDYHKHRLIYLFLEFFLIATQAFSNNAFDSQDNDISRIYGISTCCLIIISAFYSYLNYNVIVTINEANQKLKLKEKQNKKD